MVNSKMKAEVLADPSASDFIKFAIRKLEQRDSVDASNDVEVLYKIFVESGIDAGFECGDDGRGMPRWTDEQSEEE